MRAPELAVAPGVLTARAAFEALRDTLRRLEELLILDQELSDEDLARGYVYILGIQKWYADILFQGPDRDRPRFVRFHDEVFKFGFGNPDNIKFVAEIHGDAEYLIRGRRGTTVDVCIELRSGMGRRLDNTHSQTISFLDGETLQVDSDGGFEVKVGGAPGGHPNHLPTRPDATCVFVRQTVADWDHEDAGVMTIEKVGAALPPPPLPSAAAVSRQLSDMAEQMLFLGTFIETQQRRQFWDAAPTNAFPRASAKSDGYFPGQHNAIGRVVIEPDEALVVSMKPPICRYFGLVVSNPKWFACMDYHLRQNSLNSAQARLSSDGLYHFVISGSDPGVPNWLDTIGRRETLMFLRCQGLATPVLEEPVVAHMPLSEVRRRLPDDEPVVGQQERFEALQRRRLAVYRRFF